MWNYAWDWARSASVVVIEFMYLYRREARSHNGKGHTGTDACMYVYIITSGESEKFRQAKLVSHRKNQGSTAAVGYKVCLDNAHEGE